MHGRHCEVVLLHLLCQPVNLSLGVAEDDCLGDGEGVIQVTKGVELPLLFFYRHKELLDALQAERASFSQCKLVNHAARMCNGQCSQG